ncbi:MAG: tyrosine-type recombinase/integrase [Promethearchaeota archaeon]
MIDLDDFSLNELNQLQEQIKAKKKEMISEIELRENDDLLKEYLDLFESKNTKRIYKTAVKKFIKFIGEKNLQFTRKMDLERYFEFLYESDHRKETKRLYFEAVKSFFRYFLHRQEIDPSNTFNLHFIENPNTDYKRKWKDDEKENFGEIMTNDGIKRVLHELKRINIRNYIMLYIIADTSMRVDGMTNIKLENIKMERRIIITKDKNKLRKYAFGKKLKLELEKYLMVRKRINSIHHNDIWLFFSQKSTKFTPDNFKAHVYPKIARLIKKLTGKKITAHDFRRSFRTNRLNLKQLPGHIDILMNHKTKLAEAYEKPTDEMLVQWFDSFEEL